MLNGNVKGYEVLIKNASKEYTKKVRIFQHGDSTCQLFVLAADTILNSANGKKFFEDFRFTTEDRPTKIFLNKTAVILADMLSADSASREAATEALGKAPFTAKDLPLLHKAYLQSYQFNEGSYSNTNQEIATAIEKLKDSSTLDFVKDNYNKTDTTIVKLRMGLLNMLGNLKTSTSFSLAKILLTTNPPQTAERNELFYDFLDTLQLAKNFFPDCASLFGDSIFGAGFINTAVVLTDSNLINPSIITSNAKGIFATAGLQLKQIKKDPDYYAQHSDAVIAALTKINSKEAINYLNGYLKVKDFEIKTEAAVALVKLNQQVLPEHLKKIAADKGYRIQLYDKLRQAGKEKFFPSEYFTQQKFAESYFDSYSDDDESEGAIFTFVKEKTAILNKVQQRYFIYKMTTDGEEERLNYLAVCGPFDMNRFKAAVTKKYPDTKIFWEEKYDVKKIDKQFDQFIKDLTENEKSGGQLQE